MSASDKKKLRKAEKMAQLTERQQAEQKEAKKLKTNTIVFVTVITLVLCIGIGSIAYNWFASSGLEERWTTAVEFGDHKLSAAELNYYYINALNNLSQDWYSMYLLQYEDGFQPAVALDQQQYKDEAGKTWGDYFVDEAINEAAGVLALCDAANKAGHTLTEDEKASIEDTILSLETQGTLSGFGSLEDYLKAMYGNGAQEKTFRKYLENTTLAQSYYSHYTESLEYTADDIAAHDEENRGTYSKFTYTSYEVDPDEFMEHDSESGEEEHSHSEEEIAAALSEAKEIAETLAASGATNKEELDAAIAALDMYKTENTTEGTAVDTTEGTAEDTTEGTAEDTTEGTAVDTTEGTAEDTTEGTAEDTAEGTAEDTTEGTAEDTTEDTAEDTAEDTTGKSTAPTSTQNTDYEFYYIETAIGEWLAEEGRKAGDIAAIPGYVLDDEGNATEEIETYYVVIFESENKQEQNLVSARHILVAFEGGTTDEETGDTVYSDEEKKAASDKAESIKAEYEAGEQTQDAFAELAKKYSDDNAEEGGLYEDIYPGQMMETFEDWCYDETRKPGDVGIVETPYGYHVMYFVEQQEETHREYLITTDMRAEDSDAWYTELRDSYKNTANIKNTSYMNTSIVLSN